MLSLPRAHRILPFLRAARRNRTPRESPAHTDRTKHVARSNAAAIQISRCQQSGCKATERIARSTKSARPHRRHRRSCSPPPAPRACATRIRPVPQPQPVPIAKKKVRSFATRPSARERQTREVQPAKRKREASAQDQEAGARLPQARKPSTLLRTIGGDSTEETRPNANHFGWKTNCLPAPALTAEEIKHSHRWNSHILADVRDFGFGDNTCRLFCCNYSHPARACQCDHPRIADGPIFLRIY